MCKTTGIFICKPNQCSERLIVYTTSQWIFVIKLESRSPKVDNIFDLISVIYVHLWSVVLLVTLSKFIWQFFKNREGIVTPAFSLRWIKNRVISITILIYRFKYVWRIYPRIQDLRYNITVTSTILIRQIWFTCFQRFP